MPNNIVIPENIRPYIMPFEIPGMMIEPFPEEEFPLAKEVTKEWLENAIPLDVYGSDSYRLRKAAEFVYSDIKGLIKVASRHRAIEAIKTILVNLFKAKLENKPVRYSRNKNHYTRDRRYGKLFFKFDRIIPIIDAMEKRGYIHQKNGFFVSDMDGGRQTRMWGTPHLWSVLQHHSLIVPGFYHKHKPEELIELRDVAKHQIGYRETHFTKQAREDLERYNKFVEDHTITVKLDKSTPISRRWLIEDLYRGILNKTFSIQRISVDPNPIITGKSIDQYSDNSVSIHTNYNPNSDTIINIIQSYTNTSSIQLYSTPPTMTNTFSTKHLMPLGLRRSQDFRNRLINYLQELSSDMAILEEIDVANTLLDEEFSLGELGLDDLEIELNYESLHRVFNRKSFKKGGRAFGAIHQNMPKHLRPLIHINGAATTEIDFGGYHILMLYHMQNVDYQKDPYRVCGGDELRKAFKIVGLITINAKDEKEAGDAIREEFKEKGVQVDQPDGWFVNEFKKAHKPIQKFLCSGIGLSLQNTDSIIMNNILMRLMDMEILGLSVYDSVIVQEQHEAALRQIMVEEYKDVMGFDYYSPCALQLGRYRRCGRY